MVFLKVGRIKKMLATASHIRTIFQRNGKRSRGMRGQIGRKKKIIIGRRSKIIRKETKNA